MPQNHPLYDLSLSEMEISVFDLETTGLSPVQDRIIQFAVVPLFSMEIGVGYESKVHPGDDHLPLKDFIVSFTGVTTEAVQSAPNISETLQKYNSLVGTRVVAGHNIASFDLRFIRRAELRTGLEVQSDYYIDTLKIAYKIQKQGPYKLADCARYYGIDVDENNLHDALVDTTLCAKLLIEQIKDLANRDIVTFGDLIRFLS